MLEVEIKIKTDLDKTTKKLLSEGFIRDLTVYEYDRYFNGKSCDLKAADKALRIREHRDLSSGKTRYILNFKGPKIDDVTMTREETQFEIPSLEAGETILNGLGFYIAGTVEKNRIHYRKDTIVCCLDTVTGLGTYLEIEIMAEEAEYDSAVGQIEDLLARMGLSMKDTLRTSYLCMLQNI